MPQTVELLYRDKPMTREPSNIEFDVVIARLKQGLSVAVILEPGDGTRYDLHIAYMDEQSRLMVMRTSGSGGYMRAAGILDCWSMDSSENQQAITILADHNDWTRDVFAWWFAQVVAALES